MLTGTAPFVHDNRIDTMHAILHRDPRLPGANGTELPIDVQRILTKALAKIPKDRYQTVDELAGELKTLKRDLDLGKTLPIAAKDTTRAQARRRGRASDRLRAGTQRSAVQSRNDYRRPVADRRRRRYRQNRARSFIVSLVWWRSARSRSQSCC
jgi:serine/threonine protein kinase